MEKPTEKHVAIIGLTENDTIKCPGCDLRLPINDLNAQVRHMNIFHPDIVAQKLKEIPR